MLKKILIVVAVFLLTVVGSGLNVQADDAATIAELKQQISALQRRVEELEARNAVSANLPEGDDSGLPYWDPFVEINRMQAEMDQMFQRSFGRPGARSGMFSSNMSFDADLDLQEKADGYELKFDMRGLDKDKVDIQIHGNSITVKGERSAQNQEKGQGEFFYSQSFGSFMKTIPLPIDADTAQIKTAKEGDYLVVRMPKKNK